MYTTTTTAQIVPDGIERRTAGQGITVVQTFPPPEDILVRILEPASVTNPADLLHEATPRIVPASDDETEPESRETGPRDSGAGPAGPDTAGPAAGPARRAGPGRRSR